MTEAQIFRKPEPCDREDPLAIADLSHRHEDGRVCTWTAEDAAAPRWLTVTSNPERVETSAPVEVVDDHAAGLYPKYYVKRIDGRDAPGGDREDAMRGYFVLDPIFDPMARPALAMYAMVARQHGYVALADDIDRNLDIIAEHVDAASPEANIRVLATLTYDAPPAAAYKDHDSDPEPTLTTRVKIATDGEAITKENLSLGEIEGWANDTPHVRLIADA